MNGYASLLTIEDRLWSRVVRDPAGCWEWQGGRNNKGYGQIQLGAQMKLTHRLAYEFCVGPIPKGLHVCHSCDNPACVRPSHLWTGTQSHNMQDMADKKRGWAGRTLCKYGHPLDGVSGPRKHRYCRTCTRASGAISAKVHRAERTAYARQWRRLKSLAKKERPL